jgi:hypothetical protein
LNKMMSFINQLQYWRFDPPLSLPWFSRNEIWIELFQEHVDGLQQKFSTSQEANITVLLIGGHPLDAKQEYELSAHSVWAMDFDTDT